LRALSINADLATNAAPCTDFTPAARFSKRTPKVCPRATTVAMAAGAVTLGGARFGPDAELEEVSSSDREVALAPI
jgi:hypothetical protein